MPKTQSPSSSEDPEKTQRSQIDEVTEMRFQLHEEEVDPSSKTLATTLAGNDQTLEEVKKENLLMKLAKEEVDPSSKTLATTLGENDQTLERIKSENSLLKLVLVLSVMAVFDILLFQVLKGGGVFIFVIEMLIFYLYGRQSKNKLFMELWNELKFILSIFKKK